MKIEIELGDLLEAIWTRETGKGYVKYVDGDSPILTFIEQAYALDPTWQQRVHIQYTDINGGPLQFPAIWRYKDWKDTYDSHLEAKEKAEIRIQTHNLRAAQIQKIADGIQRKFSGAMDNKIATETAFKIYSEKNTLLASSFGIQIDEIFWEEQLKREVIDNIIPKLKQDKVI